MSFRTDGSKMACKETKDIVSVFRELAKYAQPTCASISNLSTSDNVIVNTQWSQRDLVRGEKTTFLKNYFLSNGASSDLRLQSQTAPQEVSNIQWNKESLSGKFRAIVQKLKNKKGEEKQYIEIWDSTRKLKTVDVLSSEKHGKVYEDGIFGCLEWSRSEKFLLYTAEKKVPKTCSFFKEDKKSDEEEKKEEVIKGDEYLYREDWGEQMMDKCHGVLCVLDIDSGEVTVLDNIPEDVSAAQACWSPNDSGAVFVGFNHEPFRLGIIYCHQRRSRVYFVDLKNTKCSALSEDNRSVRSIRVDQEGHRLVYLDNPASGGHQQCTRLMMYDWETKTTSVIIDVVGSTSVTDEFPGLFSSQFPSRTWLPGGKEVILNTFWRSTQVPVLVNIESKTVKRLDTAPHKGTSLVVDVWKDYVILISSAPDKVQCVMVGKASASDSKWLTLGEEITLPGISWEVRQHQPTPDRVHPVYKNLDYESVLYLPTSSHLPEGYQPPLIVFPHGGPHTTFDCQFQLYPAGFCLCGYAVLMVNYRGSLGFGQNSVDSLLGNVGDQDVKDCCAAALSVVKSGQVDSHRLAAFGGSHGGFLTTHLIGQYPSMFKAAACRNPVTDLTTKGAVGDLPDKVFEEIGQTFDFSLLVNADILEQLWKRSPLSYVDRVRTPLLLVIGKDDKRVPTTQARQYYRNLKARKQKVRFLAYEDNAHPIISVPAESDCFVNIMLWFAEHLDLD